MTRKALPTTKLDVAKTWKADLERGENDPTDKKPVLLGDLERKRSRKW